MKACGRCERENPDDGRFCSYCGLLLATPEMALVRRTATMVFVDLVGSTRMGERLDPEALTSVLRRYFEMARGVMESHGGTVMKFMGDAVVSVFGLPTSHEDDPLRAVRATWELLREVDDFNVQLQAEHGIALVLRAGINTGEVAADANALDESFVFGDTANTAARLEQHAPSGGILLGETTYRAAGNGLIAEEQAPFEAKGKSAPVRSFRVLAVEDVQTTERPLSRSNLVGRDHEITSLREALDRATIVGVQAITLVGEPGIGKSRLIAEFTTSLQPPAQALIGRCLPYGEGVTYWPVREILTRSSDAVGSTPLSMLRDGLTAAGSSDAGAESERIAVALGVIDSTGPAASFDEIVWGISGFVRQRADRGPTVIVFDDIHFAGPTVLRLIEQLVVSLAESPVLIVCAARREFATDTPDWGERTAGALLHLGPLDAELSLTLMDSVITGSRLETKLADRIQARSGGNPLFLEQTVRMLFDENLVEKVGSSLVAKAGALDAVPTTLQSLLSARIDQLAPTSARLLTRSAVLGESFDLADLAVVAPELSDTELRSITDRLKDHGLFDAIGDHRGPYAFRHALIRDAAYDRLGKHDRAELHARVAERLQTLESHGGMDFDETIGFHLERAYLSRVDLGAPTEADQSTADIAAQRLTSAGRRAARRGDVHSSAELMQRALALPSDFSDRARLQTELGIALLDGGRLEQALAAFSVADGEPRIDDDTRILLEVVRYLALLQSESAGSWTRAAHERGRVAVDRFAGGSDDLALLQAGWLVVLTSMVLGEASAGRSAIDKLMAARAHLPGTSAGRLPGMLAMNLAWGPTPAPEALAETTRLLDATAGDSSAEPFVLAHHAHLLAMSDRIDEARAELDRMRSLLERQGQRLLLWGAWGQGMGRIELDAGEPARAERAIREGYEALIQLGERGYASTLAGQLAHVLVRERRSDEAEPYIDACRRDAGEADVLSQLLWRTARAEIDQRAGRTSAIALIDEAIALAGATEWPTIQGQVLLRAAALHADLEGTDRHFQDYVQGARSAFGSKGNVVGLRQTDDLERRLQARSRNRTR